MTENDAPNPKDDLFGEALLDLYHGEAKESFYIVSEGVEEPLDLAFYLSDRVRSVEAKALSHAVGRILDIGCGAGRVMAYLQALGHDVVGIDIDAKLVELCRKRGLTRVSVSSYEQLTDVGTFETLLLMDRNIGMGGNTEGLLKLFELCHDLCCPQGLLIFDSVEVPPEYANPTPGVSEKRLRYKYGASEGPEFGWIHINDMNAKRILADAGWTARQVYREGGEYSVVASRA
jgi:SAM-dependent methyltransferase